MSDDTRIETGQRRPLTPAEERKAIREYVNRWRWLGPELERIKADELRAMTDDQRRRAARSMIDLAARLPKEPKSCGLVEQQRLFARART